VRLNLISGRVTLRRDDIERLLTGKFENPLLGLYGPHLVLLKKKKSRSSNSRGEEQPLNLNDGLIQVVERLRQLVELPHPDIEAIALAAGVSSPTDVSFPIPPMLRRSWSLICGASASQSSIVPGGSLADTASAR